MGSPDDVAGARKILPKNALPGVVDLPSNKTYIVTPVNPNTAGSDIEPQKCGSPQQVVERFGAVEKEYQIKKIENAGGEKVEEVDVIVKMRYGENSKQIMDDWRAENIVIKTTDDKGQQVLLEQRIDIHTMDNLLEQMKKEQFRSDFENNKNEQIKMLVDEITRVEEIMKDIKLQKATGDE